MYIKIWKECGSMFIWKTTTNIFMNFLDKEELLKAIETEKWEQPMVLQVIE